jgi:hypothetical protein
MILLFYVMSPFGATAYGKQTLYAFEAGPS